MGTVVVGAVLVGVVALIVRSMVKDKKNGNHCSAVVTVHIAEDIAAIKGTIWRC